ncbi:DoxX family protein [Mycolicibacterium sp.]|uniref:DoxX family protein n=1 Tax=Mycolicibacterium sp. TaxID=2320850 RepID=UPI001A35D735|nr:DoxX family protein [Mycolicibacterium sp.]MBJ7341471.1 DoxX family protein [Mycolicibacterium sp.]
MTTKLDARLTPQAPAVLSLFRVVFGLLFLCHATSHLFGWPLAAQQAPVGTWPFWYAGVLELVTAILITVGLFTRIAAFVASGVMAFAFFTQHLPTGIIPMTNGGELAVLYCFAFFLLIFTGGGVYAIDSRRRNGSVATTRASGSRLGFGRSRR